MQLLASLALAFSLFISPSLSHEHPVRRHHVHRQGDLAHRDSSISCQSSRFTYFQDGLGACGITNTASDFIVALDSSQFSSSLCFQEITITIDGKSTSATITDECPGCPPCGLDFSEGLFQFFGDLSVGVLTGDWSIGSGGSSPSSSSSPPPPPPPTTTSAETPTSTWVPPPTTTSQPSPTTTSSSPPTTSSMSSSSTSMSLNVTSLVPTQTITDIIGESTGAVPGVTAGSSVLDDLNLYLVLFGDLLESCNSSQ